MKLKIPIFNFDFTPESKQGVYETSLDELRRRVDAIPWYSNFIASLANWCMLAGFIVLPSAFDDDDSKFKLSTPVLRGFAIALVVLGYILTGLLCWQYKNVLFQLESIFMPGFMSSALGLMGSLFNVYGKVYTPPDTMWSSTSIIATVLSGVFMLLYGVTALSASREVKRIRIHDDAYQKLVRNGYEDESRISQDELMRRQMLNLLLNNNNKPVGSSGGEARCVCGGSGSGMGSTTNLATPNQMVVMDGENIHFPASVSPVYDPERSEREERRLRLERQQQQNEEQESGLGLPQGLRRPSAGVEMRANVTRVGSIGCEEHWLGHH